MGTIINHSQWNHVMTSLEPDTSYAMQVVLNVQGAQPVTSPMFTYMTMAEGDWVSSWFGGFCVHYFICWFVHLFIDRYCFFIYLLTLLEIIFMMKDAKIKVINAAYSTYTYISNKALKTANFICVTTSHLIRITLLNVTNLSPSIISAHQPPRPLPRLLYPVWMWTPSSTPRKCLRQPPRYHGDASMPTNCSTSMACKSNMPRKTNWCVYIDAV